MGSKNSMRKMNGGDFCELREEINARFNACMSLNNTVLVVTGAFWLLIFTSVLKDVVYSIFSLCVVMIIILIACAVYTENTNQISVLASYIMIFHEYPSIVNNKNDDDGLICWEFSQIKTSMLAGKKARKKVFKLVYYSTYMCLAIANIVIFSIYTHNKIDCLWFSVIFVLMIGVIFMIARMTWKNVQLFDKEPRKNNLKILIKIAKDMNVIDNSADEDAIIDLFFDENYAEKISDLRGEDVQ